MSVIKRSPHRDCARCGRRCSRRIITPLPTTQSITASAVRTAIRVFAAGAAHPIARRMNPCTALSATHSHRSMNEALGTSPEPSLVLLAAARVLPHAMHRKLPTITAAAIMPRRTKLSVAARSHTLSEHLRPRPSIPSMWHSSEQRTGELSPMVAALPTRGQPRISTHTGPARVPKQPSEYLCPE